MFAIDVAWKIEEITENKDCVILMIMWCQNVLSIISMHIESDKTWKLLHMFQYEQVKV